jgi:hypothetical protein
MKKIKTLKMVKSNFFILLLFLMLTDIISGQPADSAARLPQITMTPDPGFGPYIAGQHQHFSVIVTGLPQHTSSLMYRFIDVDKNQIGDNFIRTGTDITIDTWETWLDDYNLPLSPQFHLQVTYQTDSIANYYVPFVVYPDTVSLAATAGWGPFVTNSYSMVNGWNPVANQYNTFKINNLPPRTEEVDFSIIKSDSSIVQSFTVTAPQGQYLDSAAWPDVLMTNLPVNTLDMNAVVKCNIRNRRRDPNRFHPDFHTQTIRRTGFIC